MNYLITPRYSINKRGGKRQPSSKQPQAIIQIKENSVMSNLFTEVSVEQQEMVSGGIDGTNSATFFSGQQLLQAGGTNSGFGGSTAAGGQASLRVNTAAQQTNINNAALIVFAPLGFTQVP
jgi:hypothetical protein